MATLKGWFSFDFDKKIDQEWLAFYRFVNFILGIASRGSA